MTIEEAICSMKEGWSEPRDYIAVCKIKPMAFVCHFSQEAATQYDIAALDYVLPPALSQFWKIARSARLFHDCTYGQWGLDILIPSGAADETRRQRQQRQDDYDATDLVVGRFLGDSDLLVVRCNQAAPDFGTVLVALPLDPRNDWYLVAKSLDEFFTKYVEAKGDKYWEHN